MVCFHVAFSVKSLITATPMFEVNLLSSHLEKKKKEAVSVASYPC